MTFIDTVGQSILHPPIGFLQRELIPGTFTDSGDLTRPASVLPPFNNVNAYGLTWSFFSVPVGIGRDLGTPDVFEERMVQLSAMYEDFAGHELVGEFHDFRVEGIYWLWEQAGPKRIHYEILDGVELVFHWLIVRIP